MSPSRQANDQARHLLYEVMQEDLPFEEKTDRALELGEAYLDVQNAHLTRIDPEIDFWEAIASTDPPDGNFPPGEVLDLQATYCRRVIDEGSAIALHDAAEQGWAEDPAYQTHGLNCYHGTPLTIDGDVWGTLCFVSEDPRTEPFTENETLFAELIARLLEHELHRTRQQTEINLLSNLIGVLSRVLRHNLRNDLNVIRGQLTKMAEQSSEPLLENLSAVNRIDKLVNLANTARKLESIASSDLDRQPVELNALVENIIERVQRNHPEATFTVNAPEEALMEAIPSLRTGLEELIENGVKHASDEPKVVVSIDSSTEAVVIGVADNGPGLPQQEREVLRDGAESPLVHGSGLGLWLAYWIVSNHDGTIETEVTDDGTRITVTLPRTSSLSEFAESESLLGRFHREQDKFEAVFEESFDGIVIINDEGLYTDVNESAAQLFGLAKEELQGRSIKEFLPEDFDADAAWDAFMDSQRERDTFTLVRSDGKECTVEYSAVTDIVPGQHLAILRDITDRVEREQLLKALSEGFPDLCFLMDEDGIYREVLSSAASVDWLYTDPEEFIGKSVTEVLPPDQGNLLLETIEQTLEIGEAQTVQYGLDVPAGNRVFEARTHPLAEKRDGRQLVAAVVRDVTEWPSGEEIAGTA